MQIRKLEIVGFKSFVDRTVFVFDHDITGVVGPNGCGKSNIVDAIRWVMGEQSAQRLRGKAMDDVIFNGSEARKPQSFAEVTLTFDNSAGLAPPTYRNATEIAVTRRITREGGSDYLINRSPARLLDVTELFLGTGVGRRAYSIIEQGRIGFIVSSRPEDRREIIEEAAGVTKFKSHRRTAERKMEQTRQNLERVKDILDEIERSLASLTRQAQKAERYKRYRAELRDHELRAAVHGYLELWVGRRFVEQQLIDGRRAEEKRLALLAQSDAALEAARAASLQAEQAVHDAQRTQLECERRVHRCVNRCEGLQTSIRSLEASLATACGESAAIMHREVELSAEVSTLVAELDQLEASHRSLQERAAALETRWQQAQQAAQRSEDALNDRHRGLAAQREELARGEGQLLRLEDRHQQLVHRNQLLEREQHELTEQLESARQAARAAEGTVQAAVQDTEGLVERSAALDSQLETARTTVQQLEALCAQAQQTSQTTRSRLQSLQQIAQRFEGVRGGARQLLVRSKGETGLQGVVAERFGCAPMYTRALAAALGTHFDDVLARDTPSLLRAMVALRQSSWGRATVRVAGAEPPTGLHAPLPPERASAVEAASAAPASSIPGSTPLLACLQYDAADAAIAHALLGSYDVVPGSADLEAAGWGTPGFPAPQRSFVTLDGEVFHPDGSATGGEGDGSAAQLIEMQREIAELGERLQRSDAVLAQQIEGRDAARADLRHLSKSKELLREQLHAAELRHVSLSNDLRSRQRELASVERKTQQLAQDQASLVEARQALEAERCLARERCETLRAALTELEAGFAACEAEVARRRQQLTGQSESRAELRAEAAQARQAYEGHKAMQERLERSAAELRGRYQRLRRDVQRDAEELGALRGELCGARQSQEQALSRARHSQARWDQAQSRFETLRVQTTECERAREALRVEAQSAADGLRAHEMSLRESELAMTHLCEQIHQRHRLHLPESLVDYHHQEPLTPELEARTVELQRLIDNLGAVNLTAIDEHREKSERHAFLSQQRDDLEAALKQLEDAIQQMDRESQTRFRDTFAAVNSEFQKAFPRLFGGGRAELRLSNSSAMLHTGVEIVAQPPGKRLGSLELMSGGEKALTAVSLLFAIFQHKPSPFCILDEVDAPLDEANVGRFADAVRSMTDRSQFILITHSKRTMSSVDLLYGVTMEQPGVSKLVSVELRRDDAQRAVA